MDAASTEGSGTWLVFGLTGQVGQALRESLHRSDPALVAVSREPPPDEGRTTWRRGSLADFPDLRQPIDAIVSLGPLDAFSQWFERSSLAPARVVALGSTSVHGKKDSPDAAERALARTLRESEQRLVAAASARGSQLTVLRPTLVYGNGRDRNLSRLVGVARRWGWLPLPLRAGGLRQPVHVADVAGAVLRALRSRTACPGFFDLPGGETIPFDLMVRRTLAVAAPRARLVRVPGPLLRSAVRLARVAGRPEAAGEGVMARLDRDLVYDPAPARIALGQYPRGFQPSPEMFPE